MIYPHVGTPNHKLSFSVLVILWVILYDSYNLSCSNIYFVKAMTTNILMDCSLEISIWDYEKNSGSHFLGGVRMNLGKSLKLGYKKWPVNQEAGIITEIHAIGWMLPKRKFLFGDECSKNPELRLEKHYHYAKGNFIIGRRKFNFNFLVSIRDW